MKKRSILSHFARFSAIAFAVAICVSLLASFIFSSISIIKNYQNNALLAAEDVREILGTTSYDKLFSADPREERERLRGSLRLVCTMYNAEYIYLCEIDRATNTRTYIFCVAEMDEEDEKVRQELPFGTQTSDPFSEQELKAADGNTSADPDMVRNGFGYFMSWYFPYELPGSDKSFVIGVDYDSYKEQREVVESSLSLIVPLALAIALIVAFELMALKRSVSDPLGKLSERMSNFTRHGVHNQEHTVVGKTTEIAGIETSFDQMTEDINAYVERISQMSEVHAKAVTELDVARRIQLGLIPPTMHCVGKDYDAYAFERTARAVGGDFYDLVELNDGKLMCVIADVSGKGVSAALFMAMFRTLLRENLQRCEDPARALNKANDVVAENNPECMFVTLVAAVYDPATGVLTYANAGHNPPLMTDGTYLSPDPGVALGVFDDAGIVNETLVLKPGEGILFYTDGATESVNTGNEFFGEERLVQAVQDKRDAESMVHAAVDAVDAFAGEREQFDDLTMLALFATGTDAQDGEQTGGPMSWRATLVPELSSFTELREHVVELCGESPKAKQAVLACDEAFSNVVHYAGATAVEVALDVTDSELVARIADDGMPFDPLARELEELAFDDLDMGGMGIMFIKESSDDVAYEYVDGKNVLTLRFKL